MHAGAMNLGDRDGHGHFGMLDENDDGLLCHECGRRFTHLGLHAWRGHGLTAGEYRKAHGLSRSRGLIASATRQVIASNARRSFPGKSQFIAARDPTAARAARKTSGAGMSPEGLATSRARLGQGRKGAVVVCEQCGCAFCPLTGASRRRFCSRSCASRAARWTKTIG